MQTRDSPVGCGSMKGRESAGTLQPWGGLPPAPSYSTGTVAACPPVIYTWPITP
ncbi:MAG: hypothetical protein H0X25_22700 [Acidobacteriales bacterium]|nr:hypothetical protein [Terriglobales bacterium]